MTFTVDDVRRHFGGGASDYLGGDRYDLDEWSFRNGKETPFGTAQVVAGSSYCYGDGNEQGFVFTIGDRYFHASGYYSSWDSSEYNEIVEVEPVQVTVTRFRTTDGRVLDDPTLKVDND